jgi:hypothetical protein
MMTDVDYPSLDDVKRRVIKAVCTFYRCDWELLDVNVNERSITHKLAEYLQSEFPYWHVDCEYNRLGSEVKRLVPKFIYSRPADPADIEAITVFPDIIVHRRRTNYNLLVVEVKKAAGRGDMRDVEKLKAFTRVHEYEYKYGLFLKIGPIDNLELKLYENGSESCDWSSDLRYALKELGYDA